MLATAASIFYFVSIDAVIRKFSVAAVGDSALRRIALSLCFRTLSHDGVFMLLSLFSLRITRDLRELFSSSLAIFMRYWEVKASLMCNCNISLITVYSPLQGPSQTKCWSRKENSWFHIFSLKSYTACPINTSSRVLKYKIIIIISLNVILNEWGSSSVFCGST